MICKETPTDDGIQPILDHLMAEQSIDFAGYRRNTIHRRLQSRLIATGMPDHTAYLNYLKLYPSEFCNLTASLLIKVSCFFRNPFVFEILKSVILPDLIDSLRDEPLRIWCAGCARGEEAYSLAICLRELQRAGLNFPSPLIIATDIDRKALEEARIGRYAAESLLEVRKRDFDRWFTREGTDYTLHADVRAMVTFAHHDLTSLRPPSEGIFSGYHLIICRNVLIYFGQELKEAVVSTLTRLLTVNGVLVLGEAEVLPPEYDRQFREIVGRSRIYQKEAAR